MLTPARWGRQAGRQAAPATDPVVAAPEQKECCPQTWGGINAAGACVDDADCMSLHGHAAAFPCVCRCYLNGIHIKGLLTIQTLFAKVRSTPLHAVAIMAWWQPHHQAPPTTHAMPHSVASSGRAGVQASMPRAPSSQPSAPAPLARESRPYPIPAALCSVRAAPPFPSASFPMHAGIRCDLCDRVGAGGGQGGPLHPLRRHHR